MKASLRALGAAAMAALFLSAPMLAHSAIFEDTDARREILKLRKQVDDLSARIDSRIDTRIDALNKRIDDKADTKGVIDVTNEIEKLRAEIANLRGQIEVLGNEIANAQRRQKDFYNDLDQRLRNLEPRQVSVDGKDAEVTLTEQKAFDAAVAQFKAANYTGAAQALSSFLQRYPESAYLPQAYFWLGSSHFALQDCAAAIPSYQTVSTRFPMSQKAADALLNIASCQLDLKDKAAARETLSALLKKYPASPAAATAKERLAEIK